MQTNEPKLPVIKIGGMADVSVATFGCNVSINDMPLTTVQRVEVIYDHEEFAQVTITLCGKLELDDIKGIPLVKVEGDDNANE